MITADDLEIHGYEVLEHGGHIRIDPTILPHDWHDVCKDFGVSPDCEEIILAVCGVKAIYGDEDA